MSLINLKTDLKSLKYGRDTIDGGDSKLPLVKTPIPENFAEIGNTGGFDSTLRGGSLIGTALTNDIIRIGKLINTSRTFQGAAFKSKMNLLSRTNVKTQVDTQKYNQGEYQTRNTIAQISADPFGTRFELFSGNLRYFDAVKDQQIGDNPTGRLIDYYTTKINTRTEGSTELTSYDGGPGSTAGFGTTTIKLATDRTGVNNPKLIDFYGRPGKPNPLFRELNTGGLLIGNESPNQQEPEFLIDPVQALGFSTFKRTPVTSLNNLVFASGVTALLYNPVDDRASNFLKTAFKQSTLDSKLPSNSQGVLSNQKEVLRNSKAGTATLLSFDQITEKTLYQGGVTPPADFREDIPELKEQAYKVTSFNRIKNYKTGDPGSKTINKKVDINTVDRKRTTGVDSINFRPILSADKFTKQQKEEDLVPFYITLIKYNGQNQVMQFRAYVKGFTDNYSGEWNAQRFAGRGENFYTYGGFNREISLSFTVHAQTKAELLNNYHKLNYLASTLAPDYGKGFMRGNFLRLTYGDYIKDIPGVLKGLSFSMPDNSPWDIGRNSDGTRTQVNGKELEDRLPHIIEVGSFNFAPIHDFVPQLDSPFIYATNEGNMIASRIGFYQPINTVAQEQEAQARDRRANTEVSAALGQNQLIGGATELEF